MLLGIFFVVLEARRNHEDPDGYLDLTIITLIAGVIGARLLYAAFRGVCTKMIRGRS